MGLSEDTSKRIVRSSALSMALSVLLVSATFLGALIFFPAIIYLSSSDVLYTIEAPITTNFATYVPIPVQLPSEAVEFSIEPDFSNVVNFNMVSLSPEQKEQLRNAGFLVILSRDYGEMYEVYPDVFSRNDLIPNFVTSDVIIHAFHTLISPIIVQTEAAYFRQDLLELTKEFMIRSYQEYNSLSEPWKSAAKTNTAIFAVAVHLLNENVSIPGEMQSLVFQETNLIEDHQNLTISPILGELEDYSLYTPSEHYLDSNSLIQYYQATTWLGRVLFRLQSEEPGVSLQQIENETRQAILITHTFQNNQDLFASWEKIFDVSSFFIGTTNDLTVREYLTLLLQVFGDNPSLTQIETNLDNFIVDAIEQASKRKNELIYEGELGYRFLNPRFLLDAVIFQKLSTPNRLLPSGLDIMAVLGSSRAYQHLSAEQTDEKYQNNFLNLNQTFTSFNDSDWTSSLYWLWSYSLMPLLSGKGEDFLPFMRQEGWRDKDLMTSLGAWTELRQDTLQYNKTPSYGGAADPEFTSVKGYVEPNPEVFARLASLSKMIYDGLNARNLLDNSNSNKLLAFYSLLLSLKSMAEKELVGTSLAADEHKILNNINGFLEWLSSNSSLTLQYETVSSYESGFDFSPSWESITWHLENETETPNMARLTTIFESEQASSLLYEAVGVPFVIYVIVPIDNELYLARGTVFSYYEFVTSSSQRISDLDWQNILNSENPPVPPMWTQSYISPEDSSNSCVTAITVSYRSLARKQRIFEI
ncbi:MAG: DUF3160 domain-containing protein [Candidatus Hermodarchaeota archaeon]